MKRPAVVSEGAGRATFASGMEHAVNYNMWIVEGFAPYVGSKVMEVGIGHGGFAAYLLRYASSYVGVDIDPALVASARIAHPEHTYIAADVRSAEVSKAALGLGIDTILACNVLEHIEDDAAVIEQLLSLLPRGGHLLLYVPAFPLLYMEFDRIAGHHRRYSRRQLASLIPQNLGKVLHLEYVNPIGAVGWWLNGFLNRDIKDLNAVNRQIAIFDRYVVPISRAVSPMFARFFGQSISCVVQRR